MFNNASARTVLRASAPVVAVENVTTPDLIDVDAGSLFGVFHTAGLGVGTCAIQAQASTDELTWFDLPADMSVTLTANGLEYIEFKRAVPRFIRFQLTPGGGFDGSVEVSVRSSSPIIAS